MAEGLDGKLTFNNKGQRFLQFTTPKGGQMSLVPAPDTLSAQLQASKDVEITVKVNTGTDGRPAAIYLEGETFTPPNKTKQVDFSRKNSAPYSAQSKFSKPKEFVPDKAKESYEAMNREFHNPYNFVPAPPRVIEGELGDREPSGHDRYQADKFSGKLCVKMRVETPLLLPDTARMHYDNEHKSYPVRVDAEGKPFINPTAIKGMLRSAYEAVTNSRLSVFKDHDERLAFRMDAGDALKLVPARIENEKVLLYVGNTQMENNGLPIITRTIPAQYQNQRPIEIREMYAAWLGQYKGHGQSYNNLDRHGKEVWAFITKWEHQKFDFWNVVEIRDGGLVEPTDQPSDTTRQSANWRKANKFNPLQGEWVKGYICKTNRNIERKHDERVFFMPKGQSPVEAKVLDFENLKKEWRRLIENYGEIHEGEEPPKDDRNRNRFEWSSFIKNPKSYKQLSDETLCYAKVKKVGTDWQVLELLPVMISRRLHTSSPAELLPDVLNLRPAQARNELSPADRVFGWIGHGIKKDGTYRGQVRIGAVKCDSAKAIEYFDRDERCNWLPLQILGQPKPQQGRFYVAENDSGKAQVQKRNNEEAGYKAGRGLRGRKVYPHHNNLPGDYWSDPTNPNLETSKKEQGFYKEYRRRRDEDRKEQRDSQNRSIQGLVKENVEFKFDIHFSNLSATEAGALIWLLSLEANQFHRFGGGKPLGFGSVHLRLEGSDIRRGKHWQEFYKSLDDEENGKLDKEAIETLAKDFKTLVESIYPTILKSFIRASEGFDTNLPTHYPRARHEQNSSPLPPHIDGVAYEWFVENAKKSNNDNRETQFALSDLVNDNGESDKGLPILYHKPKGNR